MLCILVFEVTLRGKIFGKKAGMEKRIVDFERLLDCINLLF